MVRLLRNALVCMLFLLSPIFSTGLYSAEGDSTVVNVMNRYLWEWYGHQDRTVKLPDPGKRFEKIYMRYTLTCPSQTCGEWDYTTNVYLRRPTGRIDSTLRQAFSFKVNGQDRDSVRVSLRPTFTRRWVISTRTVDSTENAPLSIVFFQHPTDLQRPTDTMSVWPASYWNPVFDQNGRKVDSIWVAGDTTLVATKRPYYEKFEVIENVELGRFITPYGLWFRQGWTWTWTFDVTDFAPILRDSQTIRSTYIGWSRGSLYTLDFVFIEGVPDRDVYKVDVVYDGSYEYGNPNRPIDQFLTGKKGYVPPDAKNVMLRLLTSGHGFNNTDNAAEFSDKTHTVDVDGEERFRQRLWRGDCGQNPVYPQAGTWYYNRAGWCPGDIVFPDDYDLTPFVKAGDSVAIDYRMEPYTNLVLSSPASYTTQVQLFHSREPNRQRDAALTAIVAPNSANAFRRINPITSMQSPIVRVKNYGSESISSVRISYGINGQTNNSYLAEGLTLAPRQSAEISLPGISLGSGAGTFRATISAINGQATDDNARNNTMMSNYGQALNLTKGLAVQLSTDSVPFPGVNNGIRYEVRDIISGEVVYERGGFADAESIRDTIILADGAYQFAIYDETIADGLYPIFRGSRQGSLTVRDLNRRVLLSATGTNSSFGDKLIANFTIGTPASADNEAIAGTGLFVSPQPVSTTFRLNGNQQEWFDSPGTVKIVGLTGIVVKELNTGAAALVNTDFDVSDLANGTYTVVIEAGNNRYSVPLVLIR